MPNLIKAHFDQSVHYFSESGDKMIRVADMMPAYAANAARRLLTDAPTWAIDAGQDARNPARWMIRTPLFLALVAQAGGATPRESRQVKPQDPANLGYHPFSPELGASTQGCQAESYGPDGYVVACGLDRGALVHNAPSSQDQLLKDRLRHVR